MSTFLVVDAVLKRVRQYNPDLDVDLLWLDQQEVLERGLEFEIAHLRSALVARIADIVNQSALLPTALDAAVAMAEVLVYTCSYRTDQLGNNGHKHAMQAISLLAKCDERFDTAVDLFFDVVDRFCAHSREMSNDSDDPRNIYVESHAIRTLQNYDQTFVKVFLSKQWHVQRSFNLNNPMQRIKSIRRENGLREDGMRENRALAYVRNLSGRRTPCSPFSDSVKVLKMLQRRKTSDAVKSKVASGYRNSMARMSNDAAWRSSTMGSRGRSQGGDGSGAELGAT